MTTSSHFRTIIRTVGVVALLVLGAAACAAGDDEATTATGDRSAVAVALGDYLGDPASGTPATTSEEGTCAADEIVRVIGEERLGELGVTADDIPEIDDVDFTDTEVGIVLSSFDQCIDLLASFRDALADDVGDEAADCMADAIGYDVLMESLRATFAGDEAALERTQNAFGIAAGFCGLS